MEAFLRFHSDDGFDRVCLGYRITYRDFDGGVLGLAYVAKQGSAGGICENRFNTGIVTILNYRQRVPTQVTVLTLAHEVGHNFGSEVSDSTQLVVVLHNHLVWRSRSLMSGLLSQSSACNAKF